VGSALPDFLNRVREALSLWLGFVGLVAVVALAVAVAVMIVRRDRTRSRRGAAPDPAGRRASLVAQANDARRYAGEVAVAADRAGVTAQRRQAEWLPLQRARDAAWRAYQAADEAARRAGLAMAFPVPGDAIDEDDLVARERYLRRAATEAYRRGELAVGELCDVLAHRDGWDLAVHPIEHEVRLRRIGSRRMLDNYRTVARLESAARHTADVAAAAKTSLDGEAFTAALTAHRLGSLLAVESPGRRARLTRLAPATTR
jgi:hypothetical protein